MWMEGFLLLENLTLFVIIGKNFIGRAFELEWLHMIGKKVVRISALYIER